jgi:MraZ protein
MFFSSIFSAEEDAQGRVVLPTMLKRMAGIQKDIVTIGRGKRLEIWAAEKYYEYLEGIDYDSELKKLGI